MGKGKAVYPRLLSPAAIFSARYMGTPGGMGKGLLRGPSNGLAPAVPCTPSAYSEYV